MNDIDFSKIELLVLDVDGVLTDGRITLTESGEEIKTFNVRDGSGMKYWKRAGKKLAMISGRGSRAVTRRAVELGIDTVILNVKDKLPIYEQVLQHMGVTDEATAVMGDDLTDLPMLRRCAFSAAALDAVQEVRDVVSYVTRARGGAGCVREVIELILKKAGLWDGILQRYMTGGEGKDS